MQHDVKEAREAIEEVVDNDIALAAVCLSDDGSANALAAGQQTATMQLAAALLGSYERQVQSIEGALRVMILCLASLLFPNRAPSSATGELDAAESGSGMVSRVIALCRVRRKWGRIWRFSERSGACT
jgi:hypothetical protein